MSTARNSATPAAPRRLGLGTIAILAPLAALGFLAHSAGAAEEPVVIPPPAADLSLDAPTATAVFAGGCFWGVQGVFQHVTGVTEAVSGYTGGAAETANYSAVGGGDTGHAEAVEVTYDPSVVSYGDLLQIYFSVAHNPTQLNFQGPDRGTQYRSTIFVTDDEQAEVAQSYIAQLDAAAVYEAPIVTTIEPLTVFHPAEEYHQDYLTLNPTSPYIAINDLPKVEALEELFPALWSPEPALVLAD